MSPRLISQLRNLMWLLFFVGVALVALGCVLDSRIANEPETTVTEPEPQRLDEWLYVTTNNVLLFPVVSDLCSPKYALMQVHKGTKVLVIARHDEWVEVEQDNQAALHTHGCIHESMLEKRDD